MLDGVSLDQLRIFIAAADAGSFSAAGRSLSRAQSAVSDLIGNLEAQLGVTLFDRAGRMPKLTAEGTVLLADARCVIAGVNGLKSRARGMAEGLEPELSVVVDVFYPHGQAITAVAQDFQTNFPQHPTAPVCRGPRRRLPTRAGRALQRRHRHRQPPAAACRRRYGDL